MAISQQPPPPTPNQPNSWVNTRSPHNVILWIKRNVKAGNLRHCFNLDIDEIHPTVTEAGEIVDAGMTYFLPTCRERSFESGISELPDDVQQEMLQHSLHTDPLRCPRDCACYKNRTWGKVKSVTRAGIRGLYDGARQLLRGFAALNWQAQVALIVLLTLAISPKWAPLLISVAKAIWGKT